jgi:hypothetical protein
MSVAALSSPSAESPASSPGSRSLPPCPAAGQSVSSWRGASHARPPRTSVELASSRAFASNPNHHLWKNGRLWWIAFTLIHDGWRQERIRQSLGTDNQLEARRRRDAILALFATTDINGCVDPEPEAVRN